jgi:hypothetical protein
MNTCWIVQENPRLNVVSARNFGHLEVIFKSRQQVLISGQEMIEEARYKLRNFAQDDYVLLMGDPALIAIVAVVLAQKHSTFKALKWDRQEQTYYEILLPFSTKGERHGEGRANRTDNPD